MEIFHFHHWTNLVEETENFYVQQGFEVTGRFAKVKEGILPYHPPLTWDDFREDNPLFRIIEMRKGKVNVTFGAGKKPMFDHIGFLVTKEEHDDICTRAIALGWNVSEGERRTFIGTPIRLRIELQQREDVIEKENDFISSMSITVKDLNEVKGFPTLFGQHVSEINFTEGNQLALSNVKIHSDRNDLITDPNGTTIRFVALT